jgi:hypothetical protein
MLIIRFGFQNGPIKNSTMCTHVSRRKDKVGSDQCSRTHHLLPHETKVRISRLVLYIMSTNDTRTSTRTNDICVRVVHGTSLLLVMRMIRLVLSIKCGQLSCVCESSRERSRERGRERD